MTRWLSLGALALVAALSNGCAKTGCLGDDPACRVASPCPAVTFSCDAANAAALSVKTLDGATGRPGGTNSLGAKGDVLLENAFVRVVVAGIGNQNFLDPNGGSLLDLVTVTGNDDGMNNTLQVVGVLPGDSARFTTLEIIDERPDRVAVQVKGTLDGRPDMPIYTRYELSPCDHGVRVRTEIVNASPDNQFWSLSDGYYWSKREPIPFTAGQGFSHPSFDLLTINDAFQSYPFIAYSHHNGEPSSYATVSCTGGDLHGFNSETVSTAGITPTVVPPRGYLTFDRFMAVADSRDVEGAARIALDVRAQTLGEKHVKVTGKIERPMALALDTEASGDVIVSEGAIADAADKRKPWTQVIPDKNGNFTATVPAGKPYVVTVSAFGRVQVEKAVQAPSADVDVGTLTLPTSGQLRFEVKESGSNTPIDSEIFLTPADPATRDATTGTFHGQFATCAPWLGSPPGGSPACNRVLLRNGVATTEVPVGTFHVYAFHGPFWSLGHQLVTVTPAPQTLTFSLTRLALQPVGSVSADLHVHGAASFDSSIPDFDRVLSFAASDLEVIIATDHDVIHDYSNIVLQLGLQNRMSTVTGVETTGHIPWLKIPNYGFPLVVGHYNFWPLKYDPALPRNGGPFDELIEPGEIFDRADKLKTATPIFQLNHPWAASEFGRDLGFPRALKMDLRLDLPASDDGKDGRGMYVRSPKGGFKNDDHHSQEVMNGSQNDTLIQFRHFWFYLLNQGRLRTGTANSDTHSLVDSTAGMPRNLVFASTQAGPGFDIEKLNVAIRNGRVLGTSAPIIEATVDGMGGPHDFGLEPFKPAAAASLKLKVTAAPWAPVPEVRIVVNGVVAKTIANLPLPADPFAGTVHVAYDGSVPLDELLAGVTGDAWIVVEAGRALLAAEDLAGGLNAEKDGMPDTTDNNGDGKIDKGDVPEGDDYGPLSNPPFPKENEPGFHFANVTDNGYPYAFTNPFVLDRDGNGKFDAPGVKGGR